MYSLCLFCTPKSKKMPCEVKMWSNNGLFISDPSLHTCRCIFIDLLKTVYLTLITINHQYIEMEYANIIFFCAAFYFIYHYRACLFSPFIIWSLPDMWQPAPYTPIYHSVQKITVEITKLFYLFFYYFNIIDKFAWIKH
jgi:hypothetical protein